MRIALVLVAFWIASLSSSLAAEPSPSNAAEWGQWTTYYYVHKNAPNIPEYLAWLQSSQQLEKKKSSAIPIAAFLSVVFSENKSQLPAWLQNHTFTGATKETVESALWLSGNGELIQPIFSEKPVYINAPPPRLLDLRLKQPTNLDVMWGAFMASGDERYPKKIIDVLDERTPLTGNPTADTITRAAAEWSLSSNMIQHERVRRLVYAEAATRSGAVKQKLQAMTAKYEQRWKPLPTHDGDFSAMLMLLDEKSLQEFSKPVDEGVHVTNVSKAKPGDVVAIKIVFYGMQLRDDLSADVTYDLKVLDPKGKIYSNLDAKNVIALHGKSPRRFSIFDNQNFYKIAFEKKDPPGVYVVTGEIRDNVGNKKVPLAGKIELIP